MAQTSQTTTTTIMMMMSKVSFTSAIHNNTLSLRRLGHSTPSQLSYAYLPFSAGPPPPFASKLIYSGLPGPPNANLAFNRDSTSSSVHTDHRWKEELGLLRALRLKATLCVNPVERRILLLHSISAAEPIIPQSLSKCPTSLLMPSLPPSW